MRNRQDRNKENSIKKRPSRRRHVSMGSDSRKTKRRIRRSRRDKLIKLLALVLGMIIVILLISINLNKNRSQEPETTAETPDTPVSTSQVIESINEVLANADKDLDQRISNYLDNLGLDHKTVEVAIKSQGKDKIYKYGDQALISMRNNNIYVLYLLAKDLFKSGQMDPNQVVEFEQEAYDDQGNLKNEKISKPINKAFEEAVVTTSQSQFDQLANVIEEKLGASWKSVANRDLGINITEDNQMTQEDVLKVLALIVEKDDQGQYKNKDVMAAMIDSAANKKGLYALNTSEFVGVTFSQAYDFSLESGLILGPDGFVYLISSSHPDVSLTNEIRNIIYNWHEDYK